MFLPVCLCLLTTVYAIPAATLEGTIVDFTDPKVKSHIDALALMGASCVIKTQPTPADVKAYLTNTHPITYRGKCFVACMLQSSDVMHKGQINREILIKLASLINGSNSRVVQTLKYASKVCLRSVAGYTDRCELGSTFNDCLNSNMREFRFPEEIAEEILKVMPFHRVAAKHL